MRKLISLPLMVFALTACHGSAESTHMIRDYQIERLFEQDGCYMYRFRDDGMKYFLTCGHGKSGSTEARRCSMVGKVLVCNTTRIQTATIY